MSLGDIESDQQSQQQKYKQTATTKWFDIATVRYMVMGFPFGKLFLLLC